MYFRLVDSINNYAEGRRELDGSCIVKGLVGGFDISDFSGLIGYVRETFQIDPEMAVGLCTASDLRITDQQQLSTYLCSLAVTEPTAVPLFVVEAAARDLRGAPAPPLPALDFSGAGTLSRDAFTSQLKEAIYPGEGQHHRQGALTREAMRLLATNPGAAHPVQLLAPFGGAP